MALILPEFLFMKTVREVEIAHVGLDHKFADRVIRHIHPFVWAGDFSLSLGTGA